MARRLIVSVGSGLVALALAASAQATFFSFASDVNSNSFTFAGTAASGSSFNLTDFSRPNTFMLLIDDDNGPLPTKSIAVELHANLSLTAGNDVSLGGGLFQHTYRVTGTFGFYDTMGNALLTVSVGPTAGIMTVPGGQNTWATSGAVLGADSFADVTYTASAAFITALGGSATAAQYGIPGAGGSAGPDDFAFDLSMINAGAVGAAVTLDPTTHLPNVSWRSESSYSGSGFGGIPSPGAASLCGIAFAMAATRRRR